MTHIFHKLICRLFGHSKTQIPAVFFRSWDNVREIGSLHCKRCGAMLGEYQRYVGEPMR